MKLHSKLLDMAAAKPKLWTPRAGDKNGEGDDESGGENDGEGEATKHDGEVQEASQSSGQAKAPDDEDNEVPYEQSIHQTC